MKELDKFKKSSCTCKECVGYCERDPGWFRPKEIPLLSEFLDLPIAKTFKQFLIADFWITEPLNIYVLTPVKDLEYLVSFGHPLMREVITTQKEHNKLMGRDCDRAGSCASWGYAFIHAPCIFLKDNRCTIYPVRPFECAVASHGNSQNRRELISREWCDDRLVETLLNKGTKKEK